MNGVLWVPSEPMSGEDVGPHNSNGVHAFKSFDEARRYAGKDHEVAIGRVKLWGQIIEHETGYRAQFARPTCILDAASDEKKARIHRRYGLEQ